MMLSAVRNSLLEEARSSPALLSDLAGLEHYIAESYNARSFVELLQNADDAEASRVAIQRVGELLVVANDGREFTQKLILKASVEAPHRRNSVGLTLVFEGLASSRSWDLPRRFIFSAGNLKQLFPAI